MYNFMVGALHGTVELVNVVLFLPMWLVALVIPILTSPLHLLRLVMSPTAFFVVMHWMVTVPLATPIIWALGLPVHLLNLLTALIVYVWGPKRPAL